MSNDQKLSKLLITNIKAIQPGQGQIAESILIEDGKITGLNPENTDSSVETHDGHGCLLTPGMIDVHTHGVGKSLYEKGLDAWRTAAELLKEHGTTTVIPTIVPNPDSENFLKDLESWADACGKVETVNFPGLHIEGPFVAMAGAACVLRDGDVALLDEMLSACKGKIAVMSLAPDVPGIVPVIERLVEAGVVPFITHTQATVEQTEAAIEAGARHATHFYDVFYAPEPTDGGARPVGCVEAMLADPRCTVDFICDGVHVHPTAVKAAIAAKGWQNVILITDSNIGAGFPEGQYDTPWGYPVYVKPGAGARIIKPGDEKHGKLSGSALTMDRGLNNLIKWLNMPFEQILAMATLNPAKLMNMPSKGKIDIGADADLLIWQKENGNIQPVQTWTMGKCVWQK